MQTCRGCSAGTGSLQGKWWPPVTGMAPGRFEGSGYRWSARMSTPKGKCCRPQRLAERVHSPQHSQGPRSCPQPLVSGSRSILPWMAFRWACLPPQISSWPWASWRRVCPCPDTPRCPGDSSSESLLSGERAVVGMGLGAWVHRHRGAAGAEAAPLGSRLSAPAALVWGGAPGVDSEPGARPAGQPSSPSSRRPAPSSSSSPGCRPSLRRPSPAPRWVGHQAARRVGAPQGVCREPGSFCPGSGSSDTVWLSAGAWCTQERPSCCPVCPPNCGQSFLGLGGMQGS